MTNSGVGWFFTVIFAAATRAGVIAFPMFRREWVTTTKPALLTIICTDRFLNYNSLFLFLIIMIDYFIVSGAYRINDVECFFLSTTTISPFLCNNNNNDYHNSQLQQVDVEVFKSYDLLDIFQSAMDGFSQQKKFLELRKARLSLTILEPERRYCVTWRNRSVIAKNKSRLSDRPWDASETLKEDRVMSSSCSAWKLNTKREWQAKNEKTKIIQKTKGQ